MFEISDQREERVRDILDGLMSISEVGSEKFRITVIGEFISPQRDAIKLVGERAKSYGLLPLFRRKKDKVLVQFVKKPQPPQKSNYKINIILFVLTILTTMFAGALQQGVHPIFKIYEGIPFSITIILILGSHEFGHYFASKRLGISATLPYFIPFPHLIGTFGAVIKVKEPITDRRALVEIGAAGPIVGMIFAIPAVIIGLKLSTVVPVQEGGLTIGNSLLFSLISKVVIGEIPPGKDILLHQVAFAGWIGFFVTALNLLPMGQLDGGHVIYGFIGKYQKWVGWVFFCSLFVFGFLWPGWFLWAVLILWFVKVQHPAPLDDVTPIAFKHKFIAIVAIIILILTFIPAPFRI
jgi:membrane-associated protease RseP (regulator of RpoE activity)